MKNISITTAVLLAVCRLASAGALSDKNPNLTVQSLASPNWTGFYLGAFAGYKYSPVDHDLTLGGSFNQILFVKSGLESRGSGDLDNGGTELGGLPGFNYQFRQLIFGVEAAGGYLIF